METHAFLFDGTNAGIALKDKPALLASSTTPKLSRPSPTASTSSSASPI